MTHKLDDTLLDPITEQLIKQSVEQLIIHGISGFNDVMAVLYNHVMKIERGRHLGAHNWQRSDERIGYANGYKPKQLKTRNGLLNLAIPQTRDTDFYPQSLERGMRSEKALQLAFAEMYIQGTSTRKVGKIMKELSGYEVTSSEVSRCTALLDEELEKWRNRALGEYPYVILDARYEKVRHAGHVVNCAVLIAMGIDKDGKRDVLGVSVALSEQEVHWRQFLSSLKDRGLCGIRYIVSDAHEGLKAAKRTIWPSVPWQRCQFHLQQNAQSYIPKKSLKKTVAEDIRDIFNAPSQEEAQRLLDMFIKKYEKTAPKLSAWAETALPQGFTAFNLPKAHQKRLRTSNAIERLNKDIKRRTRVVGIFPNEASCLRLISAMLVEISEEWQMGKTYLNMDNELAD